MLRLLVAGGSGFIGSNFIRHILQSYSAIDVTNLDLLTYAGNPENLHEFISDSRYHFLQGDICDSDSLIDPLKRVDVVVNFAAESHVDRSIDSDYPFVRTNVLGVQSLLSAARSAAVSRFIQISTDEVYGDLPWRNPQTVDSSGDSSLFTESSPLQPRSPYAASKAAGDLLTMAYFHTHGLPVILVRSSNNYGPYQFPEKLIPLMITNALEGKMLPIYGDGMNVRDWLHVRDHCRGIERVLFHGQDGEVYNLGGGEERTNLQVVQSIVEHLNIKEQLVQFVADREGHDRRYAIDYAKAERELGWRPSISFDDGLSETINWYRDHFSWWERVRTGEYQLYYDRMYGPQGSHALNRYPDRRECG